MSRNRNNANEAIVTLAKEHDGERNSLVVLASGVRARLMPVAAGMIEEAQSSIKPPTVPKWFNPDKDREEDNPNDPVYVQALRDTEVKQHQAALDAMIMFGVVLVDEDGNEIGVPELGQWATRLRWMEKRGQIDLSGLDLEDPMDREFVYKKYIAVSPQDIISVSRRSGFGEREIQKALDNFRDS